MPDQSHVERVRFLLSAWDLRLDDTTRAQLNICIVFVLNLLALPSQSSATTSIPRAAFSVTLNAHIL